MTRLYVRGRAAKNGQKKGIMGAEKHRLDLHFPDKLVGDSGIEPLASTV